MSTLYKATVDAPPVQTNEHHTLMVRIWDVGPVAPEPPEKPALPTGKEGSPENDLALIEFKAGLANYETALKLYGQAKKDFAEWHKTYAGPYEMEMFSVNAREAMVIEPARYFVSDDRLKNHGLPVGRKPGKFHADQQEREAEARRAFARTMSRDPVFGTQGAPQ